MTEKKGVQEFIQKIKPFYQNYQDSREKLSFEIDGLVLKIDDESYQQKLGIVGKRPRYVIAWKFAPMVAETKIIRVEFQVGRTGAITPVGILQPIFIGGATVSRVTLHNQKEIVEKDIRLGDSVKIIRSGEVIPKILEVIKEKRNENHQSSEQKKIIFLTHCPVCKEKLTEDKGGIIIRCLNPNCKQKIKKKIIHFASKEAMNITGVSIQMIEEWFDKKLILNFVDLYKIDAEVLKKMERMGEQLQNNILTSIGNSKKTSLDKFIYALGIKVVGQKTSKQLAEKFSTLNHFFHLSKKDLLDMDEIGENLSQDIYDYFHQQENQKMIDELLQVGITIKKIEKKQGIFNGKKILFTGKMMQPRRILKEKAEQLGAEIVSSISQKTDYLIVGENPGSKLKKANEFQIKILQEKEFIKMVSGN